MDRAECINDFKKFLNSNREKLLEKAIAIEDLPKDDAWLNDNIWDEVYKQEVIKNGSV